MNSEYLQASIGLALTAALSQAALRQAVDPITLIVQHLRSHVQTKHQQQQNDKLFAKAVEDDQQSAAKEEAVSAQLKLAASEKQTHIQSIQQQFTDIFGQSYSTPDQLYTAFCQHLQQHTAATAAYLAAPAEVKKYTAGDETLTQRVLQYIAASKGHEWLLNERLIDAAANDETAVNPVTFQLLGELQPTLDNAELDAEDAENEELTDEERTQRKQQRKQAEAQRALQHVYIPNVHTLKSKTQKVQFLKAEKLGAYYALRIPYSSYLNNTTLNESIEREQEIGELKLEEEQAEVERLKEAEDEVKAQEEADEEAEHAEAEMEDEELDAEDEERIERKQRVAAAKERKQRKEEERLAKEAADSQMSEDDKAQRTAKQAAELKQKTDDYLVAHITPVQTDLLVCVDTLGQNRSLTTEELKTIQQYSKLLQSKLIELDRLYFFQEREQRRALLKYNETVNNSEESEEDPAEDKEKLGQQLEKAGQPHTEEDVAFAYLHQRLMKKSEFVTTLQALAEHTVSYGDLQVLHALFVMLGSAVKQTILNTDDEPQWSKLRTQLNPQLIEQLQAYEPRTRLPVYKSLTAEIKAIQTIVDRVTEEDELQLQNAVFHQLLQLIKAAVAVKEQLKVEIAEQREADRVKKEEEEEEARRKAEEEEEERLRKEEEEAEGVAGEKEEEEEGAQE